ncbi:HIRAN domain-containing protein [Castellaniella sp. GW247-6E4]|uniref:HIRAN domain-containing protein n=1 Tax=Castellaniella sp. GW247-6E4 TaxID=3140380 RepID=UPI003315B3C4
MSTPIEILGLTGGGRQTDSLEIFPKVTRRDDGTATYRFFLHGMRYVSDAARRRVAELADGEELRVAIELNNPATRTAVQLQSVDGHMLGWAPRYLVADLCRSLIPNAEIVANVHRVNQLDAPSSMRVLVNLQGRIPDDFIPMSSTEYMLNI